MQEGRSDCRPYIVTEERRLQAPSSEQGDRSVPRAREGKGAEQNAPREGEEREKYTLYLNATGL